MATSWKSQKLIPSKKNSFSQSQKLVPAKHKKSPVPKMKLPQKFSATLAVNSRNWISRALKVVEGNKSQYRYNIGKYRTQKKREKNRQTKRTERRLGKRTRRRLILFPSFFRVFSPTTEPVHRLYSELSNEVWVLVTPPEKVVTKVFAVKI